MDRPASSEGSSASLIIGIVLIILLLALGGAGAWWFFMIRNKSCAMPSDCNDSTKPYCFSGKCTDKCVTDSDCGATPTTVGIHCGADGKCTAPARVPPTVSAPSGTKYSIVNGKFAPSMRKYACPTASGINNAPLFSEHCVFNNSSDAEKWCDADPSCVGFVAITGPTDLQSGIKTIFIAVKEFPFVNNTTGGPFYQKPSAIGQVQAAGTDGAGCFRNSDCASGNSCLLMPDDSLFQMCKPAGTVGGMISCMRNSDCMSGNECMLLPGGFVCRPVGSTGQICNKQSDCAAGGTTSCMKVSNSSYATCQPVGTPGGVPWP
jgi:hypothetical protein